MSVRFGDEADVGQWAHLSEEASEEGGASDERVAPGDAAWVTCPYCGAHVQLLLDPGGGSPQEYVEDCEVCCRPWEVRVRWDRGGVAHVDARTDDA